MGMGLVNIRNRVVSKLPRELPNTVDAAKKVTEYIINNLSEFRLVGKCVIKVSINDVKRIISESFNININSLPITAISGYLSNVSQLMDFYLEKKGFILIKKHRNSAGTKKYYSVPSEYCNH
jgi:hypothetical protein